MQHLVVGWVSRGEPRVIAEAAAMMLRAPAVVGRRRSVVALGQAPVAADNSVQLEKADPAPRPLRSPPQRKGEERTICRLC